MKTLTIKQKRIILIILSVSAVLFSVKAQNVWNKTYIEDRPTMLFGSIEVDDTSYKVTGVISGEPNNAARGMIGNIDTSGELTLYKAIIDSTNSSYGMFWNAFVRNNQNKFVFTGYAYDSVPSLMFGVADEKLDSVSIFKYYTPNTEAFQGYSLIQYDSNAYYVVGAHNAISAHNTNVVLIKIDSAGNRVWEKYYHQLKLDYAKSIIKLSNSNLLLGCVRNTSNTLSIEHSYTWLLEVDTEGNFVRQWFDPNDSTYAAEGLKQTADGGFIYGSKKKSLEVGGIVATTAAIVKMNNSFGKQWVFNDGAKSVYTEINDVEELIDGSFIACGNKPVYDLDSNSVGGWIVRLSSTGQIVWNRVYKGINAIQTLNFLSDIDVLPDGSLIAVGQCQQSGSIPPQVGWFLKLDSNGCEVENCLVGINDPQAPKGGFNNQIQIQPNPASDRVWLEVEPGLLGGELKIYDISGRLVKQLMVEALQFGVEVSYLSKGVYVISVEHEGAIGRGKLVKE